jgi:type II secretory pathway component GspD/PulD (secretin)
VIDEFLPKLEEYVERSKGKIRADKAHRKITAMGYAGSERTTRRAVAELKAAWRADHRRVHRPWVPESTQSRTSWPGRPYGCGGMAGRW